MGSNCRGLSDTNITNIDARLPFAGHVFYEFSIDCPRDRKHRSSVPLESAKERLYDVFRTRL